MADEQEAGSLLALLGEIGELPVVVDLDDLTEWIDSLRIEAPRLRELRCGRCSEEDARVDEVAVHRLDRAMTPHIEHRLRTEALAEQDEARTILLGHAAQISGHRVHHRTVLLDRQRGAIQRHGRRQQGVLHGRDRGVAEREVLHGLGEHVIDVSAACR